MGATMSHELTNAGPLLKQEDAMVISHPEYSATKLRSGASAKV
jgi:hypothetical protein